MREILNDGALLVVLSSLVVAAHPWLALTAFTLTAGGAGCAFAAIPGKRSKKRIVLSSIGFAVLATGLAAAVYAFERPPAGVLTIPG